MIHSAATTAAQYENYLSPTNKGEGDDVTVSSITCKQYTVPVNHGTHLQSYFFRSTPSVHSYGLFLQINKKYTCKRGIPLKFHLRRGIFFPFFGGGHLPRPPLHWFSFSITFYYLRCIPLPSLLVNASDFSSHFRYSLRSLRCARIKQCYHVIKYK